MYRAWLCYVKAAGIASGVVGLSEDSGQVEGDPAHSADFPKLTGAERTRPLSVYWGLCTVLARAALPSVLHRHTTPTNDRQLVAECVSSCSSVVSTFIALVTCYQRPSLHPCRTLSALSPSPSWSTPESSPVWLSQTSQTPPRQTPPEFAPRP